MDRTLAYEMRPERVGRFLVEVANLRIDDERSIDRFMKRYADFLPSHGSRVSTHVKSEDGASRGPQTEAVLSALRDRTSLALDLDRIKAQIKQLLHEAVEYRQQSAAEKQISDHTGNPAGAMYFFMARNKLRDAWRQPTTLGREIELMGILYRYASGRPDGPEVDNFTIMMLHATRLADRMRYCLNPACVAPYFIARRRSQKYCSDACSAPRQREYKRLWWSAHGEEWRRERKTTKGETRKRGKR